MSSPMSHTHEGLMAMAEAAARWRQDNPEGITVEVLTGDETLALTAGPAVAHRLYPDRRIGPILHAERFTANSWLVTVQDGGPV